MKTMYPAQVNSPGTELATGIDAAQDTILVADGSVLPDGPNLLTIGTDEAAETILYTGKSGDELTGVTRGFQGNAQSWTAGTKVARYFTAYDHDAAIDNIGELSTGLTAAKDRLDIEERQDVVLNAGLQILNAQRRAAFSLSGIKGRTLVNLLGRDGGLENSIPLSAYQTVAVLDEQFSANGKKSLKVTLSSGFTNGSAGPNRTVQYLSGKYYVGVASVRNGTATAGRVVIGGQIGSGVTDTTKFSPSYVKINPSTNYELIAGLWVEGVEGQYAYADEIRVYEISAAEYAALDSMTPEQIAAKYPYVDSVQPVRNPYAIRYGENLLPPFYEWALHSTAKIVDAYTLIQTATGSTQNTGVRIPIRAGETYTLSYLPTEDSNVAYINIQWLDANGGSLGYTPKNTNGQTVIAPDGAAIAHVLTGNTMAGTFTFKNPMLTLGSEAKPFKPREDSMLALQTDLFADPLTGANADEVFEKDGQYFKLTKWKKTIMNGSEDVSYGSSASGYKTIRLPKVDRDFLAGFYITKYDGKQLTYSYNAVTGADQFRQGPGESFLFLTVSNTDSGWGDNYTPTADEIKAYFMGWRMFNWGVGYDPYNGTGTKGWGKIYRGVGPDDGNGMVAGSGISTLPTTMNDMGYTPYQLVYQLATPTVEPIVSEGMLTFNEGDNQIEVGTGLVLRESAKPINAGDGTFWINGRTSPSYPLLKKPSKLLSVYKNNLPDKAWMSRPVDAGYESIYGHVQARLGADLFDPSAAYSVTYLMLDKSPIVPFSGSYATNEKAMLQELTDSVQQNATAVSVLMNKKADKDIPPLKWLFPTLLNGWATYAQAPAYTKDRDGIVHLKGRVSSGSTVQGTTIFPLPPGYRPGELRKFGVTSVASSAVVQGAININYADGTITVDSIPANPMWVSLDGISFLAEK